MRHGFAQAVLEVLDFYMSEQRQTELEKSANTYELPPLPAEIVPTAAADGADSEAKPQSTDDIPPPPPPVGTTTAPLPPAIPPPPAPLPVEQLGPVPAPLPVEPVPASVGRPTPPSLGPGTGRVESIYGSVSARRSMVGTFLEGAGTGAGGRASQGCARVAHRLARPRCGRSAPYPCSCPCRPQRPAPATAPNIAVHASTRALVRQSVAVARPSPALQAPLPAPLPAPQVPAPAQATPAPPTPAPYKPAEPATQQQQQQPGLQLAMAKPMSAAEAKDGLDELLEKLRTAPASPPRPCPCHVLCSC